MALDYKTGFGGKYGVQTDRMDKSSVGWDHVEKVEKHVSQKGKRFQSDYFLEMIFWYLFQTMFAFKTDYKVGFGGVNGLQKDRMDKSSVGWEHFEQTAKHSSQIGKDEIP